MRIFRSSYLSYIPIAAIAIAPGLALAQADPNGIDAEQQAELNARSESAPEFFREPALAMSALDSTASAQLDVLRADPTTLDVRLVDINVSALAGAAVRLAPSANIDVIARRTEQDPLDGGGFVWIGELTDLPGNAVLVVRDGKVTGNIRSGEQLFQITPLGSSHVLREVNMNAFPEEHPPEFQAIEEDSGALDLPAQDMQADPDQVRQIDVLVAYTPAADAAVSDINAMIALAVAENNLANRNSGVNILIESVAVVPVSYTESGSFGTDLARFRTPGDGFMDDVHGIRDQHGADLAILVINNGSYCGLASTIMANEASGFAAVHHSCATGYFSFAHELGHLQGVRHNPETDGSTSPFAYGHGMIRPASSDRTVMAYNCAGGCVRKPYWSGPDVMEGGSTFGDAAARDNARVLNRTATPISNFRSPPRQGATAYAWANNPGAANYSPSATYAHNSSGGDINIARVGTGRYRVVFEGIGGKGVAGGHVQVSAYGGSNHYCKSGGWSSSGDDFAAQVNCFTSAGAAADTYYNVLVRWP